MRVVPSSTRPGLSFIEVMVVITLFCAMVGMALPFLWMAHQRALRAQSTLNLKILGLAAHSYHDIQKYLPFKTAHTFADPRTGSWGIQVYPYMTDGRWNLVYERVYICPGRARRETDTGGRYWSDYFYNNYLNNPLEADKPDSANAKRKLTTIGDGSSFTVLLGHGNIDTRQYTWTADVTLCSTIDLGGTTGTMRSGKNGKSNPTGVTLQRDSASEPCIGSWGGPFYDGALMCMGDGTVRLFPYTTQNFSAFLTPTGGETVVPPPE